MKYITKNRQIDVKRVWNFAYYLAKANALSWSVSLDRCTCAASHFTYSPQSPGISSYFLFMAFNKPRANASKFDSSVGTTSNWIVSCSSRSAFDNTRVPPVPGACDSTPLTTHCRNVTFFTDFGRSVFKSANRMWILWKMSDDSGETFLIGPVAAQKLSQAFARGNLLNAAFSFTGTDGQFSEVGLEDFQGAQSQVDGPHFSCTRNLSVLEESGESGVGAFGFGQREDLPDHFIFVKLVIAAGLFRADGFGGFGGFSGTTRGRFFPVGWGSFWWDHVDFSRKCYRTINYYKKQFGVPGITTVYLVLKTYRFLGMLEVTGGGTFKGA